MPTLLEDFFSGDRGRILRAAVTVVGCRDAAQLDALLPYIPRIRQAARKVDRGGALRSGRRSIEAALAKLEAYRKGECWCESYRTGVQFEPTREQHLGYVRIVAEVDPGWSMTYEVECVVCGRLFTVDQSDGHVVTWKWKPHGEKRKRPGH